MAYYYPIKLRRYSYQGSIDADKVLLVRVRIGQRFLERLKFFPSAKDLNCERSTRTNVSITEVYYLVMCTSYLKYAYVVLHLYVIIYDYMVPMSLAPTN